MKRFILSLSILISSLSFVGAQTAVSSYTPGVTTEGAVYFLPKTGVRITVYVQKTTYKPGDLCKYADKFLRIKNVSPDASVSYQIINMQQEAFAVADTSKRFAVISQVRLSRTYSLALCRISS